MDRIHFKQFLAVSAISTLVSLVLLYAGVRGILKYAVSAQTMFGFILLSLILGLLTGAFYAIRYRITFRFFLAGILIGFFVMYSRFLSGSNEWGDLTGLICLFLWAGIGLAVGLAVQMIWRFYIRLHRKGK